MCFILLYFALHSKPNFQFYRIAEVTGPRGRKGPWSQGRTISLAGLFTGLWQVFARVLKSMIFSSERWDAKSIGKLWIAPSVISSQ